MNSFLNKGPVPHVLLYGFFLSTLMCLFYSLTHAQEVVAIDHPIHYEHFLFLIERLKNFQSPYTYFPSALGGYPFLVYGYELTYWVAALFYFLFQLPALTAYKASVVLSYAFLFIPWLFIAKRISKTAAIVGFAALFSSLPFLQLLGYGMHSYLFGLGLFSLALHFLDKQRWNIFSLLLAATYLAHPFAFLACVIASFFVIPFNLKNSFFIFASLGTSLLLCLPKVYAQISGIGWLSSGSTFHVPDLATILPSIWTHLLKVFFLGSAFTIPHGALNIPIELIRVLPFLTIISCFFISSAKRNFIFIFLFLLLGAIPIFEQGQHVYLVSERLVLLTFPFILFALRNQNESEAFRKLKPALGICAILSVTFTLRLTHQNNMFEVSPKIARITQDIKALCAEVRTHTESDHDGRVYVESFFRSKELGIPEESNAAAFASHQCNREIVGAWSGDWPMPQWKMFISSDPYVFGAPVELWSDETFTKVADLWNVSYVLAYKKNTVALLGQSQNWKQISASGSYSLWKRSIPSSWVTTFSENKSVPLQQKTPDTWVFETNFEKPQALLLSRSYDPISKAYLEDGRRLEMKKTDLYQPAVLVPEGKHTVRFLFAYPTWIFAIQLITALLLFVTLFDKPRRGLLLVLRRALHPS